jgi:hypothetical protein
MPDSISVASSTEETPLLVSREERRREDSPDDAGHYHTLNGKGSPRPASEEASPTSSVHASTQHVISEVPGTAGGPVIPEDVGDSELPRISKRLTGLRFWALFITMLFHFFVRRCHLRHCSWT